MAYRIGIDAEGGDEVDGELPYKRAAQAVSIVAPRHPDHTFVLVGDKKRLEEEFDFPSNVKAINPREKLTAVRTLAEMTTSENLQERIQGFYSIANTKTVVPALMRVPIMPEFAYFKQFVDPRLTPMIAEVPKAPTVTRTDKWYLIDAGNMPDLTKPEQFLLFAILGTIYARVCGGIERPVVGLLNIGKEPDKGSTLLQDAYKILKSANFLNFGGNFEPHTCVYDEEKGTEEKRPLDVAVGAGIPANLVAKALPTGARMAFDFLQHEIRSGSKWNPINWIKYAAAWYLNKTAFAELKRKMDPSIYGGGVVIGREADIVKSNGTTTTSGFEHCLEKLVYCLEHELKEAVRRELRNYAIAKLKRVA